ncbi:serine/threonine-protein phosphatase 6 regulatory ankyrin repeat subunit A [Cryptosporidium felis]|nr:serine/threonine-protein phosphatase 6 regulatory ankyrin repeat subunit A [Cryptosporidium felis]
MKFLVLWNVLMFLKVVKGCRDCQNIEPRNDSLEAEYGFDRVGLWSRFADGNHSGCMDFTLRTDRMLNAVANVDIGAMEQFIEMDEYSLRNHDRCNLLEVRTISSLYENAPGWGGETPLTILARSSLPRSSIMMQFLSSKGLDFAKSQMNGYTPLILAIIHKNFGAVKVLLNLAERQKYALNIKRIEGESPGMQKVEVINEVDSMGRTALFHAVLMEDDRLVESLLQAGADPNIGDFSGITPLFLASKKNLVVVVKLLLSNGADQTILDQKLRDPLSMAIKGKSPEIITALLEDPDFLSKYLKVYKFSRYRSHVSRPSYHLGRLLDIFAVLQVKEETIKPLFRVEFARNDTALCNLRDGEGRTIINIVTIREMYEILEELLEFYKNATIFKYDGYTSCNPHILDKSGRGPVDYIMTGTASNRNSFFHPDRSHREINKFSEVYGTGVFLEGVSKDPHSSESGIYGEFRRMGASLNVISDRRRLLLTKFLKLSNPLDLSSYLFELLKKGGNPTVSTIKNMVNWLGGSKPLLLHRTSRDGHNALTFALSTGKLTVAREILDILLDSPSSKQNSYRSAVKLAISYSASVQSSSIIVEVALRKPMIIHEWICERKLSSLMEVEELKFVLLKLPREFVGFSKHQNLCKPLYTIVKQILDPDSQIESTDIVALMLSTNGGLPFLEPSDVTMALKSVGTSLSISASFGLKVVPCLEWTSSVSYTLNPYFFGVSNPATKEREQESLKNAPSRKTHTSSKSHDKLDFEKSIGDQPVSRKIGMASKETSMGSGIELLKNPGKITVKYGLESSIITMLTGHGTITAKRNQILDLVFSCPLRQVDPILRRFQRSVLIITLVILIIWILLTSFLIVFSSRTRLDIFGFVPKHSGHESERLAFTQIEWKVYKLGSVIRFISLLYCIIILTTVGRVRHVLYTVFFLIFGLVLKLNQLFLLKESDISDIATAFIREEMSDKDNTALNRDLEDNNDDVNDHPLGIGNPVPVGGQEETKQEGIHLGTIGEEFSASHSSETYTNSRDTFQSDIVKREHISAEEYARITLFIGICSFIISVASNLQRYLFGNFREFYRFHDSYHFISNHTYIAISTEVILIMNTWSLAFSILKAPGLIIFILKQRIQVLRYFLLAYPEINQNIFNSIKRTQIGFFGTDHLRKSPNTSSQLSVSKGAFYIPPGRLDIVLCQWIRVRYAIMKRMHRRCTVACKPYNTVYFTVGFIFLLFIMRKSNNLEQGISGSIFHYLLFDEFGFTLLTIFASYSITLIVIVWFACISNQISEMQHWRLFWDAFAFMPPCSAQQIVLQHIKLTQDLDNEDKRVDLWSIPITNFVRNVLLLFIVVLWVYISIIGISYTFI